MIEVCNLGLQMLVAHENRVGSTERLPSAHRCCYYTVDCATTRAHWSIFLWKELQFSVSFVKASFGHGRAVNDQLWQRNGLPRFHPSLYFTVIDSSVYFHTVMDGIVPPSLLLVQIIMNQYVLKAQHQKIILTHDLYPPLLQLCGWLPSPSYLINESN